jgi:hypothetical protein
MTANGKVDIKDIDAAVGIAVPPHPSQDVLADPWQADFRDAALRRSWDISMAFRALEAEVGTHLAISLAPVVLNDLIRHAAEQADESITERLRAAAEQRDRRLQAAQRAADQQAQFAAQQAAFEAAQRGPSVVAPAPHPSHPPQSVIPEMPPHQRGMFFQGRWLANPNYAGGGGGGDAWEGLGDPGVPMLG